MRSLKIVGLMNERYLKFVELSTVRYITRALKDKHRESKQQRCRCRRTEAIDTPRVNHERHQVHEIERESESEDWQERHAPQPAHVALVQVRDKSNDKREVVHSAQERDRHGSDPCVGARRDNVASLNHGADRRAAREILR